MLIERVIKMADNYNELMEIVKPYCKTPDIKHKYKCPRKECGDWDWGSSGQYLFCGKCGYTVNTPEGKAKFREAAFRATVDSKKLVTQLKNELCKSHHFIEKINIVERNMVVYVKAWIKVNWGQDYFIFKENAKFTKLKMMHETLKQIMPKNIQYEMTFIK